MPWTENAARPHHAPIPQQIGGKDQRFTQADMASMVERGEQPRQVCGSRGLGCHARLVEAEMIDHKTSMITDEYPLQGLWFY